MHRIFAAAALAVFCLAAPASAADPIAAAPQLAPGEVLLSVNGLGNVRSPATLATVTGRVDARGATEAEARRVLDSEIRNMTAAAREAGAAAGDIRVDPMIVNRIAEDSMPQLPGEAEAVAEGRSFYAFTTIVVRLRSVERAQALHARFNSNQANPYAYFGGGGGPVYELVDESGPRRAARAHAIANARADAESYAAAVNMRIARVVQITERGGLDFLSMTVSESNALIRAMRSFSSAQAEAQVETYAVVGVDFVLAPR